MTDRRPNLLFVFADQMRGQDMGCAGNVAVRTPVLDRLAAEGMYFVRAFANAPVCTPSRGAILTGRYAHQHLAVANDLPLGPDETTIAHVLRDAGYRTGYVGKWHLDGMPRDKFTPPGPRRFGFDFWAAWNCDHRYFGGRVYRDSPEPVLLEGYEPAAQTDLALEFLRSDDGRPWCLFLSWGPPHNPYEKAPERYRAMYDPARVALRPNVPDLCAERARRDLAGCWAHVTALDAELGRLLAALEASGQAGRTIVVFTSDHGDMLGSQGRQRKEQPWEESVRVPLLVRWPGRVPAGRTSAALVSTVDLAPTLLGMMGLEVPARMTGADLAPLVRGRADAGPAAVLLQEIVPLDEGLYQGVGEWRAIRTPRYTYARRRWGEPWLLYDNEADPYQQANLAASAEHRGLREQLEAELGRLLAAAGDPFHPWDRTVRDLGLADLWNARERAMHPEFPRLIV